MAARIEVGTIASQAGYTMAKTGSKSYGYLLLLVGVIFFLGSLSLLVASAEYGLESYILIYVLMIAGVIMAFFGWLTITNPDVPDVYPGHTNEYQLVCEKCGAQLEEDAKECPKCGSKIEY